MLLAFCVTAQACPLGPVSSGWQKWSLTSTVTPETGSWTNNEGGAQSECFLIFTGTFILKQNCGFQKPIVECMEHSARLKFTYFPHRVVNWGYRLITWLRITLGKGAYTDVLALCLGKDKSVEIVNSTLHFFGFSIIFFFNNCIGETMWAFHSSPYPFFLWCLRVSDHLSASHVFGAESESGALRPHLQRLTLHRPLSLNPFLSSGFCAAEWVLFRSAWERPSLSGEACSWAEYKSCYLSFHDTRFC